MKYILLFILLTFSLVENSYGQTNKPSKQKAMDIFIIPANKAYAEPFTPGRTNNFIPVGWPETWDAISDWHNKNKSVVWYLYQKAGDYDFYFDNKVLKGINLSFDLKVSQCYDMGFKGFSKKIQFNGTGKCDTLFCTEVKIPKTGYYRYELKPISDPAGAITIQTLIFKSFKPDGKVNHTDYQSSPSVHLAFSSTEPTTKSYDWLYEEITVPKDSDPLATFYMAIGFYRGYFGIQTNSETERRVLFSVWDSKDAENDTSVTNADFVTLVDKDPATTTNSFGGEGTGGQSYIKDANWKTGKPVQFLMNVRPQDNGSVILSAWYNIDNVGWKYVASWRAPKEKKIFDGFYSFLENYGYTNGQQRREAYYYNAWGREDSTGKWINFNKVRFSNTDGKEGQRVDYEQGVSQKYPDRFYMSSGGYTPTLKTENEIPVSTHEPVLDLKKFQIRVDEAIENEYKHAQSIRMKP
ncbi:DUF3472 domain-containing protein [Dysgonomonas sp. GY75]|uniref:DUF3472 domain-containing protein n=1 Tax=Dysgonomonas sp. GY75 TaxID=2780419 RepID=UPI001883FF6F|nr:DUF3472 domain-containing protein [Dysgonomonas sp. GY75]MBF0647381.1 DUF3472 domain-containing protein [Dysgonomonas sp. GY75]